MGRCKEARFQRACSEAQASTQTRSRSPINLVQGRLVASPKVRNQRRTESGHDERFPRPQCLNHRVHLLIARDGDGPPQSCHIPEAPHGLAIIVLGCPPYAGNVLHSPRPSQIHIHGSAKHARTCICCCQNSMHDATSVTFKCRIWEPSAVPDIAPEETAALGAATLGSWAGWARCGGGGGGRNVLSGSSALPPATILNHKCDEFDPRPRKNPINNNARYSGFATLRCPLRCCARVAGVISHAFSDQYP